MIEILKIIASLSITLALFYTFYRLEDRVLEYTHNADGEGKDNLYQRLGRTFYNLVTNAMDAEITNKVQVEINITKAE